MMQQTSNVDPVREARVADVVPLKRGPQPYSYQKRLANADAVMNTLRMAMYGMHYKDLAEKVGVSYACIMAIRSGRTAWPRPKTFFNLIDVLELDLYLVPRKKK